MIWMFEDPQITRNAFQTVKTKWFSDHPRICARCAGEYDITIHHIRAIADGGGNEPENLLVLCRKCHTEWHMQETPEADIRAFIKTIPANIAARFAESKELSVLPYEEVVDVFCKVRDAWIKIKAEMQQNQQEGEG